MEPRLTAAEVKAAQRKALAIISDPESGKSLKAAAKAFYEGAARLAAQLDMIESRMALADAVNTKGERQTSFDGLDDAA